MVPSQSYAAPRVTWTTCCPQLSLLKLARGRVLGLPTACSSENGESLGTELCQGAHKNFQFPAPGPRRKLVQRLSQAMKPWQGFRDLVTLTETPHVVWVNEVTSSSQPRGHLASLCPLEASQMSYFQGIYSSPGRHFPISIPFHSCEPLFCVIRQSPPGSRLCSSTPRLTRTRLE